MYGIWQNYLTSWSNAVAVGGRYLQPDTLNLFKCIFKQAGQTQKMLRTRKTEKCSPFVFAILTLILEMKIADWTSLSAKMSWLIKFRNHYMILLRRMNCQWVKCIFSDNTNVNFGYNYSIYTKLKQLNNSIIKAGCPVHTPLCKQIY